MRLYRIVTLFLGKDLGEETILGYALAENDGGIYCYINTKYRSGEWPEFVEMTAEAIVAARGDFESEYMGEFYDQKFGWDDLGEISDADVACLRRLEILAK